MLTLPIEVNNDNSSCHSAGLFVFPQVRPSVVRACPLLILPSGQGRSSPSRSRPFHRARNLDFEWCFAECEATHTATAEIATIKESLNRLLSIYMTKDIDRETFLSQKEALLTRKKSLQDSIEQQEKEMSRSWLEPFKEWIKTSKTLDEIAQKGSPSEKKSVASKVIRLEPVP